VSTDVRAATLDAAAHLLATEGPRGFTVRGVATAAGCSTIAVYHYFTDKQGLLDAVYVEGHTRLRTAQSTDRFTDDPEQDVRHACAAYREVALTYPDYFLVMFGHGSFATEVRTTGRDNYAGFVEVMRRWPALRTDPESAAYTLWAAGHGMVMLELTGNGPHRDRESQYRVMIDTVMHGLTTPR
jgi:AcrR family transcriptional regulator